MTFFDYMQISHTHSTRERLTLLYSHTVGMYKNIIMQGAVSQLLHYAWSLASGVWERDRHMSDPHCWTLVSAHIPPLSWPQTHSES